RLDTVCKTFAKEEAGAILPPLYGTGNSFLFDLISQSLCNFQEGLDIGQGELIADNDLLVLQFDHLLRLIEIPFTFRCDLSCCLFVLEDAETLQEIIMKYVFKLLVRGRRIVSDILSNHGADQWPFSIQ